MTGASLRNYKRSLPGRKPLVTLRERSCWLPNRTGALFARIGVMHAPKAAPARRRKRAKAYRVIR
jgi:hypothetical protein